MLDRGYPVKAPPIIIVSALDRDEALQRAMDVGIEGCLTKPVRPSLLFDTIMDIFGHKTSGPLYTRAGVVGSDAFSGAHILLVEDNEINQMVATDILESKGICVDKAENGLEAIEAVKKKRYDAVLMDIQMPVMDGIEATRKIREWEEKLKAQSSKLKAEKELKAQGRRSAVFLEDSKLNGKNSAELSAFSFQPSARAKRVPIIAMTAHAMSGDREKCIAAGMNGYVPKPIDQKELFATLREHISPSKHPSRPQEKRPDPEPASETTTLPFLPGLDIDEGVRRLGGRRDRYVAILQKFCQSQQDYSREFRELVQNGNFEAARNKAHALKGAAANLSAIGLSKAAQALEEAVGGKDTPQMLWLLTDVEQNLGEVVASVEKMNQADTASVSKNPARDRDERSPLGALLSRFKRSLKEFDPVESESCLKELKACSVAIDCRPELKDLEAQILAYDFDGAQKTLRPLSERLDV